MRSSRTRGVPRSSCAERSRVSTPPWKADSAERLPCGAAGVGGSGGRRRVLPPLRERGAAGPRSRAAHSRRLAPGGGGHAGRLPGGLADRGPVRSRPWSARSWLMTIATTRPWTGFATRRPGRRRETRHAVLGGRAPYDQTAEDSGLSLDARTVRAAVGGLSPRQRQAIELAYSGGYTYTEVSGLLDVPLGTAKSRIRDGLLLLRDRVSTFPARGGAVHETAGARPCSAARARAGRGPTGPDPDHHPTRRSSDMTTHHRLHRREGAGRRVQPAGRRRRRRRPTRRPDPRLAAFRTRGRSRSRPSRAPATAS